MVESRASKRRKLDDGGSALLPATPGDLLGPGLIASEDSDHSIAVAVPENSQPGHRKRTRSNANSTRSNETAAGKQPNGPGPNDASQLTTIKTSNGAAKQLYTSRSIPQDTGPRETVESPLPSSARWSRKAPPVQDVEMQDAVDPITPSREVDSPAPRTSGRSRKISKKLEQARADTIIVARNSPSRTSRSPEKDIRTRKVAAELAHMAETTETNGSGVGDSIAVEDAGRQGASTSAQQVDVIAQGEHMDQTKAKTPARAKGSHSAAKRRSTAKTKRTTDEISDSEPETIQKPAPAERQELSVRANHSFEDAINQARGPTSSRKQKEKTQNTADDTISVNGEKPDPSLEAPALDILNDLPAPQEIDEDYAFAKEDMDTLSARVLHKLRRRTTTDLIDLAKESAKISSLIEQTVTAGESNSMMIIGARGSGKSTLIQNVINQQRNQYGDIFHVVRLSGFTHTDDKIAIREIWRQLGREMDLENNNTVKNYADTMTTLLALLSHPSELGLTTGTSLVSKSVVIILDEFDLFTTHPRQTLLYNLFDIAQSRKAPIAVIGLTTRLDVVEALEKRVKSRFSHRQVHLPLAKTFSSFKKMCLSSLLVDDAPGASTESRQTWNGIMRRLFDTSAPLNTLMESIYHTSKSVPVFQTALLLPLITIPRSSQNPTTIAAHIETQINLAPSLQPPDSSLTILTSLSTLELALLISAARLVLIHSTEGISFALAYDEYKSLASKARIAASASGALATGVGRVWGQTVARAAWDGLVSKGLVVGGLERGDVYRVDVALEELAGGIETGMDVGGMARWCKEI